MPTSAALDRVSGFGFSGLGFGLGVWFFRVWKLVRVQGFWAWG